MTSRWWPLIYESDFSDEISLFHTIPPLPFFPSQGANSASGSQGYGDYNAVEEENEHLAENLRSKVSALKSVSGTIHVGLISMGLLSTTGLLCYLPTSFKNVLMVVDIELYHKTLYLLHTSFYLNSTWQSLTDCLIWCVLWRVLLIWTEFHQVASTVFVRKFVLYQCKNLRG